MTDREIRTCSFCDFVSFAGSACINCGGLDRIAPLRAFRKLRGVDHESLEQRGRVLESESTDETNLLVRGLLDLNLGNDTEALRSLMRAARIGPVNPELRELIQELQRESAALEIARAILARERNELGHRRIILSVDDSATVRRSMEIALGKEQHVVVSVADAEQALESLSELRPDIVFVDFELPGINGLDLCRRVRKESTTQALPIVVLSGKVGRGFATEARLAGADHFLHKPIQASALFEILDRLTSGTSSLEDDDHMGTRRISAQG